MKLKKCKLLDRTWYLNHLWWTTQSVVSFLWKNPLDIEPKLGALKVWLSKSGPEPVVKPEVEGWMPFNNVFVFSWLRSLLAKSLI